MWGWTFVVLAVALAVQARRVGLRTALGQIFFVSLLVPAWAHLGYQSAGVDVEFHGVAIDMRVALGAVGLMALAARPRQMLGWRLTLVDLAVALMAAVHVLSDWQADGFGWQPPVRAFGEWGLPYLVGRAVIRSFDDLRTLLPVALGVLMTLTAVAAFEAIVRVNAFEWAYGPRPEEYMPLSMSRWGIKRAYGPANHPIFLGVMVLLLSPWALYASSWSLRRRGPGWWMWAPVAAAVAVGFTASRGPILGLVIAYAAAAFLLFPGARKWLLGLAVLIAVAGAVKYDQVLEHMHLWSGQADWRHRQIQVEGETVRYSGTEARVYLFSVYDEAMRRAGLLGFGTTAVTGFPVNVPVGPENVETLKHVRFIDNIYVLMILRFGYLGLAAFVALLAATIVDWSRQTLAARGAVAFCAGTVGAVVGAAAVMLTVWMPHEFGFLILATAGAGSGLRAGGATGRC